MIYITGDTHRDFSRFTRKERDRLLFDLKKGDIVIVCGDFGLLWFHNPCECRMVRPHSMLPVCQVPEDALLRLQKPQLFLL